MNAMLAFACDPSPQVTLPVAPPWIMIEVADAMNCSKLISPDTRLIMIIRIIGIMNILLLVINKLINHHKLSGTAEFRLIFIPDKKTPKIITSTNKEPL